MDNVTKIAFQYAKNNNLNENVSEKGVLTFTEDKIIMGTGNGSIEYKAFDKRDFYNKNETEALVSNSVSQNAKDFYNKSEVDEKFVEVKTSGTVDLGNYYNKQQVDVRLESLVSKDENIDSVVYKGSVDTVDILNQLSNPKLGQVYTVTATKDNYIYTGTEWIKLSGIVDLSDYYTKAEVDLIKTDKANAADVYSKTEVEEKLELRSNKSDVEASLDLKADKTSLGDFYNKTDVDSKLDSKLDKVNSYSKENVDTLLTAKANSVDVYNKSEVDSFINNVYKKDETYTRVEIVDLIAEKANQDTTYTKVETNYEIDNYKFKPLLDTESYIADKIYKVNVSGENFLVIPKENGVDFDSTKVLLSDKFIVLPSTAQLELKADKASVYSKVEVDQKLANINISGGNGSSSSGSNNPVVDTYLKSEIDEKFGNYYNKAEVDAKIVGLGTSQPQPPVQGDGSSAPQIDLSAYATKAELTSYALKSELDTVKGDLANYSLKSDLDAAKAELNNYALKTELNTYSLKTEVDAVKTELTNLINQSVDPLKAKIAELEQKNQELQTEIEQLKQQGNTAP